MGYLFHIGFGWNVEALGFAYGYLLSSNNVKRRLSSLLENRYAVTISCALFSSLAFGLLYLKFKTVVFIGEYLIRAILGIAIITLIFTVTYRLKVGNRISILLGKISYEVYLLHGFIICILSLAGDKLSSGWFICMTILITVLIAIPFHSFNQYIGNAVKRKMKNCDRED